MTRDGQIGPDDLRGVRANLAESGSVAEVAQRAVESATALFGCDASGLLIETDGELVGEAHAQFSSSGAQSPISPELATQTYQRREPVLVTDTTNDERVDPESEYRSLLSVSLGDHGVLQFGDHDPDAFDERALALADLFGGYVTRVLDRVESDFLPAPSPEIATEFLDIADVMMIVLDREGTITAVNTEACEVLGYEEKGELLGRDWFETCIPERNRREVRGVFEQLMAGEIDPLRRFENAVLTQDGEERLVEFHNTVLQTGDGQTVGTLSSGLDITDRTEIEQRLSKEREKYRTLVEQFPNGLVTLFDETHRYRIVGGRLLEQMEFDAEDIEGKRLEDVFPPENVEVLRPLYDEALDGESNAVEVTFRGRIVRVRVVPVRDEDGGVFAGMTISQDITEEKARKEDLEATKRRYKMLLQAAPDPVFVADADTGEILEVNEAAEQFRGQPSEEIVGSHQTDLHPENEAETYRERFEAHVATGGRSRYLEDGSQIYAVTGDGQEVPVEISTETVDLGEQTVIYGVFRDVTEQHEYERVLTGLNEATQDLFTAEGPHEISRQAVETVTTVFDRTGAAVYLVDEDDAVLKLVADTVPHDVADHSDVLPVFEPGVSDALQAFTTGETAVCNGLRTNTDANDSETLVQNTVVVPLGEHGVLIAWQTGPDTIEDRMVDLLDILGATVAAALDRTEREQTLKEREQSLTERTRELEELEEINAQIRTVAQAIVDSETTQEIEQTVCAELVETSFISHAWIGAVDSGEQSLVPRSWAGDHEGYLGEITLSLTDESATEPAVQAARTKERVAVENTASDLVQAPWRDRALRRGFQSALSIPIQYQGVLQGVLTIYATERNVFSERLAALLSDLAELIAHAGVAIGRAHALLSNRRTELDFTLQDQSCFFLRFARETDCTLELEEVVPQSDGSWLVFVIVTDGDPEELLEAARRSPEVEGTRRIGSDDESVIELWFVEPFVASKLVDNGLAVRNITADDLECVVTVAVPPTVDIHQAVSIVSSLYPDSELVAKREQLQQSTGEHGGRKILEKLTPRQREVIETAYSRGYFDDPRNANGAEVAEELGLSSSAFHRHLRAVERELFGTLFSDDTAKPDRSTDLSQG
jgi:PAS domain S-box-containing protein